MGINFYKNMHPHLWGLFMDDFTYDGNELIDTDRAKIAIIDSGNDTI